MDKLSIDSNDINLINSNLENLNLIDAYAVFDSSKSLIKDFYKDYLQDIDLSFFKDKLETISNSSKQILLTEKGMIYVYKKSEYNFIILAGFRESTDIYNLQSELDRILTVA